jgi:hypothetical protein
VAQVRLILLTHRDEPLSGLGFIITFHAADAAAATQEANHNRTAGRRLQCNTVARSTVCSGMLGGFR